jgi:DNA-binding NtrC family response regulator
MLRDNIFGHQSISEIAVPRILVVEDDADVLAVVLEFLRTIGHEVVSAGSAEQARRLLEDEVIDLALIDCLMSGEQGNTLAEYAAKLRVPTILTSGDPDYLEALPKRSFPFLPKPFRLTALDELISRTLAMPPP